MFSFRINEHEKSQKLKDENAVHSKHGNHSWGIKTPINMYINIEYFV